MKRIVIAAGLAAALMLGGCATVGHGMQHASHNCEGECSEACSCCDEMRAAQGQERADAHSCECCEHGRTTNDAPAAEHPH